MNRKTEFQDIMGIVVHTEDAFLNKVLNKNICYKGGSSQTTVNEGVPEEFKPYYEEALKAASRGYKTGDLGYVAPEAAELKRAQEKGRVASDYQDTLAAAASGGLGVLGQAATGAGPFGQQAIQGIDVSGKYGDAAQEARRALAASQLGSSGRGTLGGARDALRSGEIEANLGRAIGAGEVAELEKQRELGLTEGARFRDQMMQGAANSISGTSGAQQAATAGAKTLRDVGLERQAQDQRLGDQEYQALQRYSQLLGASQSSLGSAQTTTTSGGK